MQLKESVQALTAEIAVLRDQVTDLPGKVKAQEQLLANTKAQIIENRDMLTAVSRYISRRAELVFEAVKMNRVSISLYDVAKSTGEVRDVFKFNYEDHPISACPTRRRFGPDWKYLNSLSGLPESISLYSLMIRRVFPSSTMCAPAAKSSLPKS